MDIGVAGPILTKKIIKVSMVKQYQNSTIWEINIVAILYIYGAIAISYHFIITKTQNLSHEKWKLMYLEIYSPIQLSKALWENDKYTLQNGKKIWLFFIFMELEPFPYYCMIEMDSYTLQ